MVVSEVVDHQEVDMAVQVVVDIVEPAAMEAEEV